MAQAGPCSTVLHLLGDLISDVFLQFSLLLLRQCASLYLHDDMPRVPVKAAAATAWLEDETNQPFYPRYAPESNPDEYLNSDVKNLLRLAAVSENREQLMEPAMTFMNRLQTWPERVRSYFQHPAAQPIDGPGQ